MRNFFKNFGYFLGEVKTIFSLNIFSGLLTVISLIMVFLLMILALVGWQGSTNLVNILKNEAEISVYHSNILDESAVKRIQSSIESIKGVNKARSVTGKEAYDEMSEVLGPDAKVLEYFDENPFDAYFEVYIDLDQLETIVLEIQKIESVEYVRDNYDILKKVSRAADFLAALGIFIILAVSITTFIITAHIIKEGVNRNEEQIKTLRLLGAPDWFIHSPFVMEGTLLTTISSVFASGVFIVLMQHVGVTEKEISEFIPNLNLAVIVYKSMIGVLLCSVVIGVVGSLLGLYTVRA